LEVSSAGDFALTVGLQHFFSGQGALRRAMPAGLLPGGQVTFLEKAHPRLRQSPVVIPAIPSGHPVRLNRPATTELSLSTTTEEKLYRKVSANGVTSCVGLQRFLCGFAALRPVNSAKAIPGGLVAFLEQVGPLLNQSLPVTAPDTPVPVFDLGQLSVILDSLREPMRRSRASGDFLQVWSVAGVGRHEVRNAAILAWLFDPRGSHGLGSDILRGFLTAAAGQDSIWPLHGADLSQVTVRVEERPLESDRDRVDISIDGPDFVIFIEVKIDAVEGLSQLPRYVEAANYKAYALRKKIAKVIYLSPRPPTHPQPDVIVLNWRHVAQALSGVTATGISLYLVQQYAVHIRSFF
jgi:hypothetical protein